MTDREHPRRVYGDEEIGRILKRATELQHREPTAGAAGVTLAELEEIAAEAGIDPAYLRRAAMELETRPDDPTLWSWLAGDELDLVREVTLPGELDQADFERLVAVIQAASREHGQPSLLGRTLTWRAESSSKTRATQIVASSRDGETTIRIEENLGQMASGLFGGVTVGAGVGVGVGVGLPIGLKVLGSVLFATAAPLASVALGYMASRALYRTIAGRRRRAVDNLFDLVVREAQRAIGTSEKALAPADPPGGDRRGSTDGGGPTGGAAGGGSARTS